MHEESLELRSVLWMIVNEFTSRYIILVHEGNWTCSGVDDMLRL